MNIPIYQVDAFAARPFAGNPAAVCPLVDWLTDDVMQAIALENNLSETAFYVPRADGGGAEFDLRWFTPAAEADSGVDFVSRFFAPKYGIDEDPVTGSAHCGLIPYWANRLGKSEMVAHQISARGGELHCRLDSDRVRIAGRVAPYLEGTIRL